jgi:hypothetical protein
MMNFSWTTWSCDMLPPSNFVDLVRKLQHRFDGLPVHRLCSYQTRYPLTKAVDNLRQSTDAGSTSWDQSGFLWDDPISHSDIVANTQPFPFTRSADGMQSGYHSHKVKIRLDSIGLYMLEPRTRWGYHSDSDDLCQTSRTAWSGSMEVTHDGCNGRGSCLLLQSGHPEGKKSGCCISNLRLMNGWNPCHCWSWL